MLHALVNAGTAQSRVNKEVLPSRSWATGLHP